MANSIKDELRDRIKEFAKSYFDAKSRVPTIRSVLDGANCNRNQFYERFEGLEHLCNEVGLPVPKERVTKGDELVAGRKKAELAEVDFERRVIAMRNRGMKRAKIAELMGRRREVNEICNDLIEMEKMDELEIIREKLIAIGLLEEEEHISTLDAINQFISKYSYLDGENQRLLLAKSSAAEENRLLRDENTELHGSVESKRRSTSIAWGRTKATLSHNKTLSRLYEKYGQEKTEKRLEDLENYEKSMSENEKKSSKLADRIQSQKEKEVGLLESSHRSFEMNLDLLQRIEYNKKQLALWTKNREIFLGRELANIHPDTLVNYMLMRWVMG